MYVGDDKNADLIAEDFKIWGWEINRDYDDVPDVGFGRWNVDVEIPIKRS